MKYTVSQHKEYNCDNLITFCFEDKCFSKEHEKAFADLKANKIFNGKIKEVYTLNCIPDGQMKRTVFVGLGDAQQLNEEKIRLAAAEGIKAAQKERFTEYNILVNCTDAFLKVDEGLFAENIIQSILMTLYTFDIHKSKKVSDKEINIRIISQCDEKVLASAIHKGSALGESVNLARDLINQPPNYLNPESFGMKALEVGEEYGFETMVHGKEWLEENRFDCLIQVGKSSEYFPRLIEMKYTGNPNSDKYIALVGKGITFDSGGYNLKKSEGLEYMKSDMGGAAAVLGLMKTIAQNEENVNVIGLIPTAENMIDGESYRAGDVIYSRSGLTIEIGNTDAEGRLILSDAMSYASEMENIDMIIDVATLTGNSAIALGGVCAAVFSNNDDLFDKLYKASTQTNEKIWRLPLFDEYKAYLMSPVADTKNTSSRKAAGAIVAGTFLSKFVKDKPWIHIDMASTNASMMANGYNPRGAKGYGVRLLYKFIKSVQKDN